MEKMIYVDDELCKKCGGQCCKKSGCDFLPSDFKKLNYTSLIKELEKGYISIISTICFYQENKKTYWAPVLSLRIKNKDRNTVDLVSYKTGCSLLTEIGCPLSIEERPALALSLIPTENFPKCDQQIKMEQGLKAWMKYQDVLSQLVAHYVHRSVKEQVQFDMDKLDEFLKNCTKGQLLFDREVAELANVNKIYKDAVYSIKTLEKQGLYKPNKNKRKK